MGNSGVERRPAVPTDVGGVHGRDAAQVRPFRLLRLRQGTDSNYSIEFQTLATDSGWEGRALVDAFLHGLAESVKDELLTRDFPDDLDRIVTMAIRVSSAVAPVSTTTAITASLETEKWDPALSTTPPQRRVWERDGGSFPVLARGEGEGASAGGSGRASAAARWVTSPRAAR